MAVSVHSAARAGRHPRPPVPNERLRHMLIGYAHVSKADRSQSLDLQRDALRAAGVDAIHVYHDFASGVRDDRPGLDSCVRALRTGDVLVVWKLNRLGRTLAHLVNTVRDLFGPRRGPAGAHRVCAPGFLGHGLRENLMSKEVAGMVQSRRVKGAGSARTEGARRASGVGADGAAVGVGALAPGQRWSASRKRDVVLRLLRGESLDMVSREVG